MPDDHHLSRANRFEKRRKNKKLLLIFSISAVTFIVLFFVIQLITSDSSDEKTAQNEGESTQDMNQEEENEAGDTEDLEENESEQSNENSKSISDEAESTGAPEVNLEKIEVDDELVINAYTGNWEPIPTKQSEPHEISWEQESQDWKEMLEAAKLATDIDPDNMSYLWVSGDGPQKVIATFSNKAETKHFRVYLSWIENEGWQPTRVDHLTENDQKN
ncbi:YrrS family protein [Paraliobacillus sp. JSM ZJ581]|uniref:YrrS family protein n=1 Tax=Paraliobacillus sp. JSM ZJ581 TaxID=3342118 RepID=UPI0035A9764A